MTETLLERLTHTTRGRVVIVASLLALASRLALGFSLLPGALHALPPIGDLPGL